MRTDATFRYGGAVAMALIFGFGFGIAVSPVLGVVVGLIAGLGWLALGLVSQRRETRS